MTGRDPLAAMGMGSVQVVSIGEAQLRLATQQGVPLVAARTLDVHVAGTEGNVLSLLSRLGHATALVSALPDSPLGDLALEEYRRAGVDTSRVARVPSGRLALYFMETGSSPVPSRVYYDRAGSCFSQLRPQDVDWDFVGTARMVHVSGITAALSKGLSEAVQQAAHSARQTGQLLSVDVNYRSSLWSPADARECLTPVVRGADVLFCARRDAALVFEITGTGAEVAERLAQRFEVGTVLVSDGAGALELLSEGERASAWAPSARVVDRVGAGDALLGGFLHGYLGGDPRGGLRLGRAAAALCLTRRGDLLTTTESELEWLSTQLDSASDIVR